MSIKEFDTRKAKNLRWALMQNYLYPASDYTTSLLNQNYPIKKFDLTIQKHRNTAKDNIVSHLDSLTAEDLRAVANLVMLLADYQPSLEERGSLYLWAAGDSRSAIVDARANARAAKVNESREAPEKAVEIRSVDDRVVRVNDLWMAQ